MGERHGVLGKASSSTKHKAGRAGFTTVCGVFRTGLIMHAHILYDYGYYKSLHYPGIFRVFFFLSFCGVGVPLGYQDKFEIVCFCKSTRDSDEKPPIYVQPYFDIMLCL